MIGLAMPVGSSHGWGVCGKYISRELAELTGGRLRLIADQFTAESVGDELEFQAVAKLRISQQEIQSARIANNIQHLPFPLIAAMDKNLTYWLPQFRGTKTLGYTFFEENIFDPAHIEAARRNFDIIATGSSWCTEILKQHGLANVATVIQGIDPRIFFPFPDSIASSREFLTDRFVIFSGGKFELRKGQDIVIRAVQIMQQRHPDVVLVNAWFNPWQHSFDTMRRSPYMRWPAAAFSGQYVEVMARVLAENGLDPARVITLGPRPNALMARIYRNSDVGIFPNRCEGGTNLVLMEYMACGKPVVATSATGHSDIVHPENAFVIPIKSENTLAGPDGRPIARWPEPDLDAAVALLEEAYQNRARLKSLGQRAGEDLARITWTAAARRFLELMRTS